MQGELWSTHARDWATLQEQMHLPVYEVVLTKLRVDAGPSLLDVGCGSGMFAMLAALRGARVSGLDAAPSLIAIARERTPSGNFAIGEMEELPHPAQTFDAVTGFNSFQYAASPLKALQEARRVTKSGGQVALVFWGRPEDCETDVTLKAGGALQPPPPPGAPAPLALSQPGVVEGLVEQAGLTFTQTGEVACPFEYPNAEVALKALCSSGPVQRAIGVVGEQAVSEAVLRSLAPYQQSDGSYLQRNVFRYFITAA
jgi:SAM-dependent methyltransferase